MPVLIHTGPQGRKSLRVFPLRLLVEGSAPKPLWTQNFILWLRGLRSTPVGTKRTSPGCPVPANAFDQDQLTAGRGLFLFQHPVLPPFSALDLHLPLPLKASAFPHGNAGTRHRSFSFLNIKLNIKGTGRLLYYQIISMCRYAQSCAFISVIELPRIPTYCPKNWVKTALVWSNDVKLYQPV